MVLIRADADLPSIHFLVVSWASITVGSHGEPSGDDPGWRLIFPSITSLEAVCVESVCTETVGVGSSMAKLVDQEHRK